ncbi:MAG: DUF2267 domain-containing protein [Solirubrobacteraceae bacterium]
MRVALVPTWHICTPVDYGAFISFVEQAAGADRERAERAARATLETIAERISAGEARHLAAQLSPELSPWLHAETRSEPLDVDELLRRVAAREGVDLPTTERDSRIVLAALELAVGPRELLEFVDVTVLLPDDYVAAAALRDETAAMMEGVRILAGHVHS